MDELKSKFLKHRQILAANCEQAEDEVKRLDEIFHETVNQVLQVRAEYSTEMVKNACPRLGELTSVAIS